MTGRLRRFRAWPLVALVALVATACPAEEEPIDQVGGTTEVVAVWTAESDEGIRFQEVLADFTQRTGTEVTYTSAADADELATVVRTRIEGGQPPGVAMLPNPGLMRDLEEQGALVPIGDVVGDAVGQRYADSWRELGSVDGVLYGLFFKAANKSTIWYNVEAFEEAGVEPPGTWEEMMEIAVTLRDAGITPFSIGGGDAWTLTDWFENIYLRVAGPELYDQLTDHEIPWTHETVVQSLEVFAEILADRTLIDGDPTVVEFVESVDAVFRTPPDAAMVYEGDFVPGVTTVEDAEPGVTFDFFEFPSIEESEPSVVGGGDMAVMLDDTPQARALIEFLATADAAEIWASQGGFTSPNRDVDDGVYPDETSSRTASALVEADIFRFDMSDLAPAEFGGTAGQGMWGILQDFAGDPSDPAGTAAVLEAAAAEAYAR